MDGRSYNSLVRVQNAICETREALRILEGSQIPARVELRIDAPTAGRNAAPEIKVTYMMRGDDLSRSVSFKGPSAKACARKARVWLAGYRKAVMPGIRRARAVAANGGSKRDTFNALLSILPA